MFWAMLLLFVVIYLFSIIFCQGCIDFIQTDLSNVPDMSDADVSTLDENVMEPWRIKVQIQTHFPTIVRSMLTLLMCMTGGMDWRIIATLFLNIGTGYVLLLIIFIVFT